MAFYSLTFDKLFGKKKAPTKQREGQIIPLSTLMTELGVRSDSTIGSYDEEEKPDKLTIEDYLAMQENDGTVRAIVRLFTMPIQAAPIKIIPSAKDNGERDFVENVLLGSQKDGGMSTTLPFVVADMTRAIAEGFRAYETVPQIIKAGKYKGKIGWRKLAPRDAKTIMVKTDMQGGFFGFHQTATFGGKTVDIDIPPQ